MRARIALVQCVGKKLDVPAPARDLYSSPWFVKARRYAEQHADRWYILSAEHGVVRPEDEVAPYERTLNAMPKHERIQWAERVNATLATLLLADTEVVVLAGERYREGVVEFLGSRGFTVSIPMAGLGIGRQLQWLDRHARRE